MREKKLHVRVKAKSHLYFGVSDAIKNVDTERIVNVFQQISRGVLIYVARCMNIEKTMSEDNKIQWGMKSSIISFSAGVDSISPPLL